jgi:hypothetical protein
MDDILTRPMMLVLNRNWQAISFCAPTDFGPLPLAGAQMRFEPKGADGSALSPANSASAEIAGGGALPRSGHWANW